MGSHRTGVLASTVAGLDVDLLAVQEVERHVIRSWFADQPKLIGVAGDADAVRFVPARRFLLLTGEDGIALCVRGELERTRVLELPRENAVQRRVAIIAGVTIGDEHVTVATTHLHNDAPVARAPARRVAGFDRGRAAAAAAARRSEPSSRRHHSHAGGCKLRARRCGVHLARMGSGAADRSRRGGRADRRSGIRSGGRRQRPPARRRGAQAGVVTGAL